MLGFKLIDLEYNQYVTKLLTIQAENLTIRFIHEMFIIKITHPL